jgi:hypothetical protein
MCAAEKRSYTETIPPTPRRYTCFNWIPIALSRMDKTRRKFFLLLLPLCALFLLVRHHVALIPRGTLSFGSLHDLHTGTSSEDAHGAVNSTLGVGCSFLA